MSFEIKEKDLVARIGKLKTNSGKIETPALLPVINPNFQALDEKEMKKTGAEIAITNAYILWKNHKTEVEKKGLHKFLKFKLPLMTDSGAFQLMQYGDVEISNKDIIKFQKKIKTDIGVPLDTPTKRTDKKSFIESVKKSIERSKEALKFRDSKRLWCGPVQGAAYPDLVKKSAQVMAKLNFDLYAVGSVVPLMIDYQFDKVINALATAKECLPASKPVHLFGAGHPMFFAFACAFGADLFDSAAYALYAKDKRYLTVSGTKHVNDLQYLPCNCPVCSDNSLKEIQNSKKLIAFHNLYVSFEELNNIKQAIKENSLWDLLEQRAHAHPAMHAVFKQVEKHKKLFLENDPLTKRKFFYFGKKLRPEFERVKKMIKPIKSPKTKIPVFGNIPKTLTECYPFASIITSKEVELLKEKDSEKKVRDMSRYWFGVDVFPKDIKAEKSRKTQRMRIIKSHTRTMCSVHPFDYRLLLHESAKILHKKSKKHRIVMLNDVAQFILKGKSAFCKFVTKCDPNIVPKQEVLIVNEKDKLLAAGEALYSAKEILDLDNGMAAKIRWVNK